MGDPAFLYGIPHSSSYRYTFISEEQTMLDITIAPEVSIKFKHLLEEEDDEYAVVRIYETKIGGG
jgi:hypothetical protein